MCFSATASFIAGSTLSAVGVVTLTKVKQKQEIPFAMIPLLFGIQQLIEGVIWSSFSRPMINTVMTFAYSIFSHVLWPIFVPVAILLLEKDPMRKKILRIFSGIGLAVGIFLFYFIVVDGISSQIVNKSIVYNSRHLYLPLVMTLYVAATCISGLFSSNKIIKIFAIAMLLSFLIAGWLYATAFISVWCFFAAILSGIVYWYFKNKSITLRQLTYN